MKTLILTKEYPPHIYGGAGVHVSHLSRALSKYCGVEVRCFGDQLLEEAQLSVTGYGPNEDFFTAPHTLRPVFDAVRRCLDFNATNIDADIVHTHTWYTSFGGILAKLNYSIPFVMTVHSLEPLRPWKREQLSGGYDFTCWIEESALKLADTVVAVSEETRKDILRLFPINPEKVHVIHNGIHTDEFKPTVAPHLIEPYGIDLAKPYILFVGRLTQQKGITHLLNAVEYMDKDYQIVICAGPSDTPEHEAEVVDLLRKTQEKRAGIYWVRNIRDIKTMCALYSHAALFCCPSIYEPFGIINLEAMACAIPVVASAVGGIKETVIDGETGLLIPVEQQKSSPFLPLDPVQFEKDLATKINFLMNNRNLRLKMGAAGRKRAIEKFSWHSIAEQTVKLYSSLLDSKSFEALVKLPF